MTIINIGIFITFYLIKNDKLGKIILNPKSPALKEMVDCFLLEQRNTLYIQALHPGNLELYLDNLQFSENARSAVKVMAVKELNLNKKEVSDIRINIFGEIEVSGKINLLGKPKFINKEKK